MIYRPLCLFAVACLFSVVSVDAAPLKVGCVTCDITPSEPVILSGQMHTRVFKKVATPLTANVLAIEGTLGDRTTEVVIVSCDLGGIRREFDGPVREAVKKALPEFDVRNLLLCATHTHTSAEVRDDRYHVPENVPHMKPKQFVAFAAEKITAAVVEARKNRVEAKFSYGLGFAVVAYNRRAIYANGTAAMYGTTNSPNFRRMEGMEDHDVGTMFFWDKNDKLLGMLVNISCPSQEVEQLYEVHADFWHPTREALKKKYGQDVTVVATIGAAGDSSPHTQYRRAAEDRMRKIRNISRIEEMGRRIVQAVDESYEVVQNDKKTEVPFRHEYVALPLPLHRITKKEYDAAKKIVDDMAKRLEKEPSLLNTYGWNRRVVDRYETQDDEGNRIAEFPVHILRIGDAAVMTNPFELFTAYGVQMKARCRAVQTFVIELTDAALARTSGYLPTAEAYKHGGYSAIPQSVQVGPEGGQMLVEESLKKANEFFQ